VEMIFLWGKGVRFFFFFFCKIWSLYDMVVKRLPSLQNLSFPLWRKNIFFDADTDRIFYYFFVFLVNVFFR